MLKWLGIGDPGGLCTWTLTGPVEAVALWAICQEAKETPLRTFQGVVRPHLGFVLLIPVCTISIEDSWANSTRWVETSAWIHATIGIYGLKITLGASLVVRWLRIHLPTQGMQNWSLVRELRSYMARSYLAICDHSYRAHVPQWFIPHEATEIPLAATKTWHSQINKYFLKDYFTAMNHVHSIHQGPITMSRAD